MRIRSRKAACPARHMRLGAATLDYILVVGIILPLALIVIPAGKHVLELVYEMSCVLIAWPFL